MHAAAQLLLGRHDFTTFRDSLCQAKSPVKTLDRLDVARLGEEITIRPRRARSCTTRCATWRDAEAGRDGEVAAADVTAALEARDRRAGGPTAPADGLYLVRVVYTEKSVQSPSATRLIRHAEDEIDEDDHRRPGGAGVERDPRDEPFIEQYRDGGGRGDTGGERCRKQAAAG